MPHSPQLNPNSWRSTATSGADHAIAALAWRQYGVVERAQLLAMGFSVKEIDYRVAIGPLRIVYPGVYAVGHERLAPEGRWLAAVFAGGARAALSHRSAARLWGLLPHDGSIEVTSPSRMSKRPGVRFIQSSVESST